MAEPIPATPIVMAIMYQMPASRVEFTIDSMIDGDDWVDRNDPDVHVTPLVALATVPRDDDDEAIRIAEMLVRRGADVNTRDSGPGSTPLFMCAQTGKPRLLRWLLGRGASIDRPCGTSRTPAIGIAANNGHTECVAVLANAARAENKLHIINIPNQLQNRTSTWVAVARGFVEIVGILSKAGADLRRAFPCWYEVLIMDGERTGNVDIDKGDFPVQHALNSAVFSFSHLSCVVCRKKSPDTLKRCNRCQLASYCSRECQTKDYKSSHKRVCKLLKKGMDMYGNADQKIPRPSDQAFGFEEEFGGEDLELPEDYDLNNVPKWEYDAGSLGIADWRRYPPSIEKSIEGLLQCGGPKYMYRPSHPECEGMEESEISSRRPEGVSTCYIWFTDMIEREVYTGAGRAVRRNGSCEPPPRPDFMNGFW